MEGREGERGPPGPACWPPAPGLNSSAAERRPRRPPSPASTPPRTRTELPLAGIFLGGRRRRRPRGVAQTGRERLEQVLLDGDELIGVIVGQVVAGAHSDGIVGAGFLAHATVDTAQQIDLVPLGISLAGRDAVLRGVLRRLDHDAAHRAGHGAQLTAHALLEAVRVAVQDVAAPVARRDRLLLLRVLDGDRTDYVLEGRHQALADVQRAHEYVTQGG